MEEEYEALKQNGIKGQQHFYSFQKFPVSFQLLLILSITGKGPFC